MKSIAVEIEEMMHMTAAELAVRYEQLWGKPPRVKHKQHLWRRCCWKLQERRLGGLSRKAKDRIDEIISEMDLPFHEKPQSVRGSVRPTNEPAAGTVPRRRCMQLVRSDGGGPDKPASVC